MIISDTAVRKSTTVLVLALLLIIVGVYSYMVLPRESEPDITIPNVFVSTSYRGVSPTDMETAITIEIEKKLKGLDGVKKIQSVSSEGLSSINIEFITGTDIDQALQDVKDKVDEALGELPTDLEDDPTVFEVNFSERPIAVFSLSGTCGLPCLKKIADAEVHADFGIEPSDDPVDRRLDGAALEQQLGIVEIGFGGLHPGLPGFEFGGGYDAFGVHRFVPLIICLGQVISGLRPLEGYPIVVGFDLDQDIALAHTIPFIDHHLLDSTCNLGGQIQFVPRFY
ncbi:MAG: efflux RND transporter permease subunit [Desulfofustis sp.]